MDRQQHQRLTDWDYSAPSCHELARFAAYALGQLCALRADHRINLEFPGMRASLPKSEIARGQRDAERWLADYEPFGE
jgi:hypothetical protein